MITKILEVRDRMTFLPILAVDMNANGFVDDPSFIAERYLLRRVGYPCDDKPNILITKLAADGSPANNDPHHWGDRTMAVAHLFIIDHWTALKDGDVVDVEFLLGETSAPKLSERLTESA